MGSGQHPAPSGSTSDLTPDVFTRGRVLPEAAPQVSRLASQVLFHLIISLASEAATLRCTIPRLGLTLRGDTIWKDPEALPFELFS